MIQYLLQLFIALLLLTVLCYVNGNKTCNEPIAYTTSGPIRGLCKQSEENNTFASFLGVPYAEQPLGEWRFKDLRPLKHWSRVYNATKEGPACPQNSTAFDGILNTRYISEACIFANVHVPFQAFPDGRNRCMKGPGLPILLFVHGGGWETGSGSTDLFGAEYLIDENVIVITFNYRLQVFGFLYLNSPEFPGNLGLRDMLTCLRWVKTNAKRFGGDPDNITFGGQSVGGVATHLMMLSNATQGLFKRGIVMSGVAVRGQYTTSPLNAMQSANTFLSAMNITTRDSKQIRQILLKKSVNEILVASSYVKKQYYNDLLLSFGPVVETKYSQEVFLDADPEELISLGRAKDYPVMIGYTNQEYQFFKSAIIQANFLDLSLENPLLVLSPDLTYKTDNTTANELGTEIENIYFNGEPTIHKLLTILTSSNFRYSTIHVTIRRKEIGAARTYLYEFSYSPDFSTIKQANNLTYSGAAHLEAITFVFKSNVFNGVKSFSQRTARDRRMIKQMTGYFKNFMVCSKPICDNCLRSLWPPIGCNNKTVIYEKINQPGVYKAGPLTTKLKSEVKVFDSIFSRVESAN